VSGAWLLLSVALAGPVGWRLDGSAVAVAASPPVSWSVAQAQWRADLPSPGHASPVPVGELLCTLSEPDRLVCVERSTGRQRWSDVLSVESVLVGAAREAYLRDRAEAARVQAELVTLQRSQAELLRQARRSAGDPAVARAVQEGSTRLDALKARLDALSVAAPEVVPEIGLAAATPVSDGRTLVSLLGTGVLAAHGVDGARRWAVRLPAAPSTMRGYRGGRTASPLWVDDVLIVAFGELRGVSAATGQVLWSAGVYRDYGTPAVARVGGVAVLFTPDGRALRVKDGVELASGLGDLWYQGPHVDGEVVYYVGRTGDGPLDGPVHAQAWRLSLADQRLRAVSVWQRDLPTRERITATPLSYRGKLIVVSAEGQLVVLDQATGAVVREARLEVPVAGKVYRSPVVAGDTLFVGFDTGYVVALDAVSFAVRQVSALPKGLATPWFEGSKVYLRTDEALWCLSR
jgi:outer membrane protein assembly factor BamB